ncbi:hypothetical protein KC19_12G125200 [Ceratodon purpureus]|uniref:Uncharacterized protein n=1 Tax=Ceratodon purpureus TaxID=3225 RepID=A0A8T0G933_CERPU|nr:hypothetical protein KC19_12G125200 [Ceratodon purpureus]
MCLAPLCTSRRCCTSCSSEFPASSVPRPHVTGEFGPLPLRGRCASRAGVLLAVGVGSPTS